jgi:hypothetical protein
MLVSYPAQKAPVFIVFLLCSLEFPGVRAFLCSRGHPLHLRRRAPGRGGQHGPPFKLVKILIGFKCGIESLAFILWTF